MSRTLAFAEQLIARPSATPEDAGCLELIASHLAPQGFQCERIDSGPDTFRVSNLWAIKRSKIANAKTLVFAGHTDVVPTGPIAKWSSDPFTPTHRDGKLFGRGSSDMKTSLAAMVGGKHPPRPRRSVARVAGRRKEQPLRAGCACVRRRRILAIKERERSVAAVAAVPAACGGVIRSARVAPAITQPRLLERLRQQPEAIVGRRN